MRPPKDTLQSFSTFQELIRRFPDSQYVPDARQRMVLLRNRLAQYENHVARYYVKPRRVRRGREPHQIRARALPRGAGTRGDAATLMDAYE